MPKLFNNTTLDSIETYRMIRKDENRIILTSKETFWLWIKKNIIPTRFSRGCCRVFKEEAMQKRININKRHLFFYGMRNSESSNRAEYMDEWDNINWETTLWIGILPIRKWIDIDVWTYIFWRELEFNKLYTYGYNRVGCLIACPYRTAYENILDQYWFEKKFNRWQSILKEDFITGEKWTRINCTIEEYQKGAWKGEKFRENVSEEVINEFASWKNIEENIAKKYFDKKCECGKRVKNEEIELMFKYYGEKIGMFMCVGCLSKVLGIDKKELKKEMDILKEKNRIRLEE